MHVVDACALSNFLHAEQLDVLIAVLLDGLAIPSEVVEEIHSGIHRFPSFQALDTAIKQNKIIVQRLEELEDLKAFFDRKRKMGKGEMACYLLAKRKGLIMITDDAFARRTAEKAVPPVRVISSGDILLEGTENGIISKEQALDIASFWKSNPYCLEMPAHTFQALQRQ